MASSLTSDNHEKQKKYVQISFEEVRDEITKLNVILMLLWCLLIMTRFQGTSC